MQNFFWSRPRPSVIDLGSPTFRPSDFHGIGLWSKREFREKRRALTGVTLLQESANFCPYVPHFLTELGEIRRIKFSA